MKSHQSIIIENDKGESLSFNINDENVQVVIWTENEDSLKSRDMFISKKEWSQFTDFISWLESGKGDDKAERKCGGCGSSGHNSRTCPLLKRPDPE